MQTFETLILIIILLFSDFNDQEVILNKDLSSPNVEKSPSAYSDDSSARRAKKTALQAMQENLNQTDRITEFTHDEVLGLVSEFEKPAQETHNECTKTLIALYSKAAETNPKNALLLIGAFHYPARVTDFERKIITYLEKESATSKSHHISVPESDFQNEHQEYSSKYLDSVSNFKYDPKNNEINLNHETIFTDAVTKTITFTNEQTIKEMVTFLKQHDPNCSLCSSFHTDEMGSIGN